MSKVIDFNIDFPVTLVDLMHLTQIRYQLIEQRTSHLKPVSGKTPDDFRYPLSIAIQAIFALDGPAKTNLSLQEFRILREQSEAILAQAKAEKMRMDIDERKATLIPAQEAKAAMANLVVCFRAKLMSLPSKCALQVAGIDDPRQAERVLRDSVYEALEELSQTSITPEPDLEQASSDDIKKKPARKVSPPHELDGRHPGVSQATH